MTIENTTTDTATTSRLDTGAQYGAGKRMVIVDPSLNSPHSHNLDYARVFIRDAQAAGYDVVVLANKGFGKTSIDGCEVKAIFKHTMYEHGAVVRDLSNPLWLRASRIVSRVRASLDFRLRHIADAMRNSQRTIESDYVTAGRKLLSFITLLGGGLAVLAARLLLPEPKPFNRDDFAISLSAEIQRLKLGAGDLVVFHTSSFGLLESLSEARLRMPGLVACEADAHFIFHMSPTAPDARTYLNRYYQFSDPRTIKGRLRVGSPFTRVHLWATSDALREELEPLTGASFRRWDHITDTPEAETLTLRDTIAAQPADDQIVMGVRASDMREDLIGPVSAAIENAKAPTRLVILSRGVVLSGAAALLKARVPSAQVVDVSGDSAFLEGIAICDFFLLPYEREVYRRRISAVLGDCAMLGVAVVAQADTTLGHAQAYADVFPYRSLVDLETAIDAAIDARADRRSRGLPRWPSVKPACDAYFRNVATQLSTTSAEEPSIAVLKTVKVAVTVAPLWGRCGSTRAFEAQFLILNSLGYFVIQTFLDRERYRGVTSIPHFFNMLRENSMSGRANVQRIALRSFWGSLGALFNPRFWKTSAMSQLAQLHATASVRDPVARRVMANADLGLINHVYHLAFGHRRIGGRKVLDTHDIQSVHMHKNGAANFITRRPESFDALYADELALVRTAAAIVNVSEEDDRALRQHNPNSTHIYPWVPPMKLMSLYSSPEEWAQACDKGPWYEGVPHFDLFLAGDAHPANLVSTMWFMENVYLPYLQPKSIRLVICGRLSDAVYAQLGGRSHVFYASFVADIDDVRALSRIALLPDRAGAGISNKTIEALSRGMAFTATSFAMRGIDNKYSGPVPVFDDPKAFAADILTMSRSARAREARMTLSSDIYRELFAFETTLDKWKVALGEK